MFKLENSDVRGLIDMKSNEDINKKNIDSENLHNKSIGVAVPKVLVPNADVSLQKWSVVACDQYTAQHDYWKRVEKFAEDSPSTLNMIYPEVYLEEDNSETRIEKINNTMQEYIENGVLVELGPSFIYVERETLSGQARKGLIMEVDLEQYDYNLGSQTLIRATEGTVLDRLPPRIKIREKASLEIPHIMLLIDDPFGTVIEPIGSKVEQLGKIYDFELMENGGNIKGYRIDDKEIIENIFTKIEKLGDKEVFQNKYMVGSDKGVLLFAVGDGNHSLATAKACWERVKKEVPLKERENHPARYALVEVVNIHDEALIFEPIHRIVFNVNVDEIEGQMTRYFKDKNINAFCKRITSKEELKVEATELREDEGTHIIAYTTCDYLGMLIVRNPSCNLEVGTLQAFLDEYVKMNKGAKIDYIHGEDVVDEIGTKKGNIGFYLPTMDKQELFKTVILDGVLPRKTFSMGEAEEKRYYLECKKITL